MTTHWDGSSRQNPQWSRSDLSAGITAAAVVVPQAMAYAAIAGLPLVVGLYTAFVPLVVYAIMGTSRVLSVTTTSTIALLTASAIGHLSEPELLAATATLTVLVGGFLLVASICRLGVVAGFMSDPVLTGFRAGVGLTIVLDQIPKLIGVHYGKGTFVRNLASLVSHIPQLSAQTAILSAIMLALLIGLHNLRPKWPTSLIVVATGIFASSVFGLESHGIQLVGEVHGGLPRFVLPDFPLIHELWPAAIGIALMSFVETAAAGQAFRKEGEPRPNPNRELFAIGMTNLVGGVLRNMPSGGGTSQTAVNRESGAHSQFAGVVTAIVVMAVLLFLAPVVHLMPQATLAAVVVVPCAGMIRPRDFREILRVRTMEFSWAVAAVLGVLALGTLKGIVVAVALSLLALIYHANKRPVFVLGRKRGTDVFRRLSDEHPDDETLPGLLMLKTEGTIHFGNASRVGQIMRHLMEEHRPRVVVIDCSAIPDFEYTAIKMLAEAEKSLRDSGVRLWLAALNPEPLLLVQKSELGRTLGRHGMHFNMEQAFEAFRKNLMEG